MEPKQCNNLQAYSLIISVGYLHLLRVCRLLYPRTEVNEAEPTTIRKRCAWVHSYSQLHVGELTKFSKRMEYHIARVNYHYRKLQMTRQSSTATDAGANVEFEAYVFFEVCFHLKDWVKTDARYDLRRHDVDAYINETRPLRLLHDLCNRLKHRTLTRPKTNIGPLNMVSTIEVGPEGAYQRLNSLDAAVDGEIICMYDLAKQAMHAWIAYFESYPEISPSLGCGLRPV